MKKCWAEATSRFVIPSVDNLISPRVGQLAALAERMQLFDQTVLMQLSLALEEALSNALYHGNLELTTEELHSMSYDLSAPDAETIVDTRRNTAPYADRKIHVFAELTRRAAKFTIRDEGPGFDHEALPSSDEVVSSGASSGRGLAQMRLFSDEVAFNDLGNEVVLVRHTDR